MLIEPFLRGGTYEKFNSNFGYASKHQDHEIIQAFSHWTYHYSDGRHLVCDLQGVRSHGHFALTDPVINSLSKGEDFGPTDNGVLGIYAFFLTHKCNKYCSSLWKRFDINEVQNKIAVIELIPGFEQLLNRRSTTYTEQLRGIDGADLEKLLQVLLVLGMAGHAEGKA